MLNQKLQICVYSLHDVSQSITRQPISSTSSSPWVISQNRGNAAALEIEHGPIITKHTSCTPSMCSGPVLYYLMSVGGFLWGGNKWVEHTLPPHS